MDSSLEFFVLLSVISILLGFIFRITTGLGNPLVNSSSPNSCLSVKERIWGWLCYKFCYAFSRYFIRVSRVLSIPTVSTTWDISRSNKFASIDPSRGSIFKVSAFCSNHHSFWSPDLLYITSFFYKLGSITFILSSSNVAQYLSQLSLWAINRSLANTIVLLGFFYWIRCPLMIFYF